MEGQAMEYVRWIEHKDKEIQFMDAAGTSAADGMVAWVAAAVYQVPVFPWSCLNLAIWPACLPSAVA